MTTTTPTTQVEWTDSRFDGANVRVYDGELRYWAAVPADWSSAEVVDALCRGYDTSIGREDGGCWEWMTHEQAIAALREDVDVEWVSATRPARR